MRSLLTPPKLVFLVAASFLLVQLAIALFEYAQLATAAVVFPFPLDYSEGPVLDQVIDTHYRLKTTLADTFVYVPAGNPNAK